MRDQLLYPSSEHGDNIESNPLLGGGSSPRNQRRLAVKDWSDHDLLNILTSVDLPDLAKRAGDGDPIRGLNAVLDWGNTLSLGEQQRLAFGRLVCNQPRLVVMDESTSALDVVAEKKMYALLKELKPTFVSVGHRPTLLAHHDFKLSLRDGLGFISEIPPNIHAVDEGFILT